MVKTLIHFAKKKKKKIHWVIIEYSIVGIPFLNKDSIIFERNNKYPLNIDYS